MTARLLRTSVAGLLAVILRAHVVHAGDPRLEYFTVETPHFHVHYHGGLEHTAQRTATLAEAIRERLVDTLARAPSETTHILLTDGTDSANGSASALPYNQVRLFVTAPEDLSVLGDYDDWMTTLATHELAHVFHLDNVTGIPALFNAILGKTYAPNQVQPRWIIEGLAVAMESRLTSGGRLRSSLFDMYLRSDVLEDRVVPLDQMTHYVRRWPGGDIWYLYGGKFIGWILEQYGPDVFAAVASDYGNNILAWGINRSIRRATGRTYTELYERWVDALRENYRAQVKAVEARGLREGTRLTHHGYQTASPRWVPKCARASDREELLYFREDAHSLSGFYRLPLTTRSHALEDEATLVARANGSPRAASFDASCGFVFDNPGRSERFYYFEDLYRQPPGTESPSGLRGTRERWTVGMRARSPNVSPNGRQLAFVTNHAGTTTLRIADIPPDGGGIVNVRALVPSAEGDQAFSPRFSPDGTRVAYSVFRPGGFRDVRVVDVRSGTFYEITRDRAMDAQPSWTPDGRTVLWSSDRTGIANVYAYDTQTGTTRQVTNVRSGAFMPELSPDGKTLVYVGYGSYGFDLFSMPFDPARFLDALPPPARQDPPAPPAPKTWPITSYNPLHTLRPRRYELQYAPGLFGQALSVFVSGADIAGLHGFYALVGYDSGSREVTGSAGYSYARLPFNMGLSISRGLVPRSPVAVGPETVPLREEILGVTSSVSYSLFDDYASQGVALSYTAGIHNTLYDENRLLDPSAQLTGRPRDLFLGTVRLGWSYSNAYSTTYAVSNEGGFRLSAGGQFAGRWSGSQATLAAFDARFTGYALAPWARHHAFALTVAGGAAGGSYPRGGYYFGGFAEQDIYEAVTTGVTQSAFVIRGYPPASFVGSQYNYGNFEYRFPIAWISRGVSTLPGFVDALSGALFADYGGAYNELDLRDPFGQFHLGVGAEARLSLTLGYFLSSTIRLGWARGFGDLATPGGRWYLAVAGSF